MQFNLKAWLDRNLKGDPIIWLVVFLLSLLSILVVYSATGTLAYRFMQGNTEYYLAETHHPGITKLCSHVSGTQG